MKRNSSQTKSKARIQAGRGAFLSLAVLASFLSHGPSGASEPGAAPEVRVLLTRISPDRTASVRGFDLKFQSSAQGRAPAAAPAVQVNRTQWRVSCRRATAGAPARVVFERADLAGFSSLADAPGSQLRVLDAPARVASTGGFVHLGDRPYRGALWFHAREKDDGCDVVNEVDLERYLDGLVNSEFSSRWSPEAIAAQVVAARTYAVHQMQEARKKGKRWDLDSTEKDQVYDGSAREDWKASRVIERTRGEVLVPNGVPLARAWDQQPLLKAYYHSTCGGFTELPENVWGARTPGFRHSVACGFCASSPRYRWTVELGEREIREKLAALEAAEPGLFPKAWRVRDGWVRRPLLSLAVESGSRLRAQRVRASFGAGESLPLSAALLRQAVGYGVLKSTAFRISAAGPGRYRFDGNGSGHGVGMCQWGAKVMGERGYSHDRILAHYYPDARIVHVW